MVMCILCMLERVCVCVQDPLTMNTNTYCSLLAYKPIDGTIEEIAKDYRYVRSRCVCMCLFIGVWMCARLCAGITIFKTNRGEWIVSPLLHD